MPITWHNTSGKTSFKMLEPDWGLSLGNVDPGFIKIYLTKGTEAQVTFRIIQIYNSSEHEQYSGNYTVSYDNPTVIGVSFPVDNVDSTLRYRLETSQGESSNYDVTLDFGNPVSWGKDYWFWSNTAKYIDDYYNVGSGWNFYKCWGDIVALHSSAYCPFTPTFRRTLTEKGTWDLITAKSNTPLVHLEMSVKAVVWAGQWPTDLNLWPTIMLYDHENEGISYPNSKGVTYDGPLSKIKIQWNWSTGNNYYLYIQIWSLKVYGTL